MRGAASVSEARQNPSSIFRRGSIPSLSNSAVARLRPGRGCRSRRRSRALEAVAAAAYGVADAEHGRRRPRHANADLAAAPALSTSPVAILGPTYGEYARAFAAAGSRVVEVSTLDALDDAPCAVICNPNNPDGRRFDAATLLALLRAEGCGMDCSWSTSPSPISRSDGLSLAPHLPRPASLVLRSLSKSYGLGGLRLGFALAEPRSRRIDPRRARALAGVGTCDRDRHSSRLRIGPGAKPRRSGLRSDVARLDAMLREAGLTVIGGTLLFRLAESAKAQRHVPAPRRGRHSRPPLRVSPRLAPLRHPRRRGGVAAIGRGIREFGAGVTIHLYTFGWNEMRMIGFFFRHYEAWVDRFIFYDDGSTPRHARAACLEDKCRNSPLRLYLSQLLQPVGAGLAEFVLEGEPRRGGLGHRYRCGRAPASSRSPLLPSAMQGRGRELHSGSRLRHGDESFPHPEEHLATSHTIGAPSAVYSKLRIFDPVAIEEVDYGFGAHSASPRGRTWSSRAG